jgi:archaemetzincin
MVPRVDTRGVRAHPRSTFWLGLLLVAVASCAREPVPTTGERVEVLRNEVLPEPFARLTAEAETLSAPAVGSWRSVHDEPGQSLAEFRVAPRRRLGSDGHILALSRLGPSGPAQERIFARTGSYLEACYGLPVHFVAAIEEDRIPPTARRAARGYGTQVRTRFVLDSLLVAARPDNALVHLALTTFDLYPRDDWNFVFGQARPSQGVGVWSIARYGELDGSPGVELQVLTRMLRTATHEVGHLLGLAHCITWLCVMNGSNNLPELDGRPLEFCPVCQAKVCTSMNLDPGTRLARVTRTLEGFGLLTDAARARRFGNHLGDVFLLAKPDSSGTRRP